MRCVEGYMQGLSVLSEAFMSGFRKCILCSLGMVMSVDSRFQVEEIGNTILPYCNVFWLLLIPKPLKPKHISSPPGLEPVNPRPRRQNPSLGWLLHRLGLGL